MGTAPFRRQNRTLIPASREASEELDAVQDGALIMVKLNPARNPLQHNLFFSLVTLVMNATDCTKDAVQDWLLRKTRYCKMLILPDGSMEIKPLSIKVESMPQAKFNRLLNAAVNEVCALLGNAPKEVWQELENLLDPDARADLRKRLPKMAAPSIAAEQDEREPVDG